MLPASLFVFSLLPLVTFAQLTTTIHTSTIHTFATTTTSTATSATTTTCPTAGLPTDVAYFTLKTNTYNDPDSSFNNLSVLGYHVGAGESEVVLWSETELEATINDLAYIDGTYLHFVQSAGDTTPWFLAFGYGYNGSETIPGPMMILVGGGDAGFGINDLTGLIYDGSPTFIGWLACDGDVNEDETVILIPQFSTDASLPATCEAVYLIPQAPFVC